MTMTDICTEMHYYVEAPTTNGGWRGVRASGSGGVLTAGDLVTDDERRDVELALQRFTDMFKEGVSARYEGQSVCYSPLSIAPVMGMVVAGLPEGPSKELFFDKIGLSGMEEDCFHLVLGLMLREMEVHDDKGTTVTIVNGVVARDDVRDEYKEYVRRVYGAEVFPMEGSPSDVADQINEWVDEHTNGMIQDVVTEDDVCDIVASLMNAVYFKAPWKEKFVKDASFSEEFKCADGRRVEKMMMHQTARHAYYKGCDFKMVEMEYKTEEDGQPLSFVVFLPDEGHTLAELDEDLRSAMVAKCRLEASVEKVELTLPKMDVQFGMDDVKEQLAEMGLPVDDVLENICDEAQLSKILHKAVLKVDEEGAEGAAVTIGLVGECTGFIPREPKEFDARRPFAFYVMAGDSVLFQGSVTDDSALVD